MRIIMNGKDICFSGNCMSICNGQVIVDGKVIKQTEGLVQITVEGPVEVLKTDASVTVNGNVNNLKCGGSASVSGGVTGNLSAGGSVHCGAVRGDVFAGGSIHHS